MTERPPLDRLGAMLYGALSTRALAVVTDLGVPAALADGPRPVAELADELGADADALGRILRALASSGVFRFEEPGVVRHTEASELLLERAWADFAHLFGGVWHRTAGELDASGEPVFPRLHGQDFWSWLGEHPSERAAFDRAMVEGTDRRTDRLARLDWRGDEVVVDVGGGNGSLLAELLRRRPDLRGIVFDLPETIRDEEALGDRLTFVAGSFFDGVPAGDAYVLSTVLHNWNDDDAARILGTIRAAAPPGARVLALETVLPDGDEPSGAKWLDVLMLALLGGRERTEPEWRKLLARAGLQPQRIEDGLVEARCP